MYLPFLAVTATRFDALLSSFFYQKVTATRLNTEKHKIWYLNSVYEPVRLGFLTKANCKGNLFKKNTLFRKNAQK